jgi:Thiolase, C-terminal domain
MPSRTDMGRRGIEPLGTFRHFVVADCEPDEMGIGPVLAVPRLLERAGLDTGDIGLWELNEAFSSQAVYCVETLELPEDKLNVNGGAISVGHPYGMSGARLVGHALLEGRRRGALGRRQDVRGRRHGGSRAIRTGLNRSRSSLCRDLSPDSDSDVVPRPTREGGEDDADPELALGAPVRGEERVSMRPARASCSARAALLVQRPLIGRL